MSCYLYSSAFRSSVLYVNMSKNFLCVERVGVEPTVHVCFHRAMFQAWRKFHSSDMSVTTPPPLRVPAVSQQPFSANNNHHELNPSTKLITDRINATKKYAPMIPVVMVITISAIAHLFSFFLFIIDPP